MVCQHESCYHSGFGMMLLPFGEYLNSGFVEAKGGEEFTFSDGIDGYVSCTCYIPYPSALFDSLCLGIYGCIGSMAYKNMMRNWDGMMEENRVLLVVYTIKPE